MNDPYGQCSNPLQGAYPSDDDANLASSCPKKRAGRKKFKETRHPVYRGVRQRNGNRWVCEVRTPNNNSRIWLGTYATAEMAARAHDVAALALRGSNACLNFADSAWLLPVPASTDPKDIQRAAAEAAETFRPPESEVTQEGSMRGNYAHVEGSTSMDNNYSSSYEGGNVAYIDEEAELNMPGLLANMAEGMLLPPPHNAWGDSNCDDTENESEVSLWNF